MTQKWEIWLFCASMTCIVSMVGCSCINHFFMDNSSVQNEYTLSVATDNLNAAIAKAGLRLYDWLEDVLSTAEDDAQLQFAVEMLSVLARHREQLSSRRVRSGEADEDDNEGFELV